MRRRLVAGHFPQISTVQPVAGLVAIYTRRVHRPRLDPDWHGEGISCRDRTNHPSTDLAIAGLNALLGVDMAIISPASPRRSPVVLACRAIFCACNGAPMARSRARARSRAQWPYRSACMRTLRSSTSRLHATWHALPPVNLSFVPHAHTRTSPAAVKLMHRSRAGGAAACASMRYSRNGTNTRLARRRRTDRHRCWINRCTRQCYRCAQHVCVVPTIHQRSRSRRQRQAYACDMHESHASHNNR